MELKPKPGIRAIRCSQCGGSVALHGGHKVRSIVCNYCGSCLDAKDEFKVLTQFLNLKRPSSPLRLGMKGKLKNIPFTVIGVLQYEQMDEGVPYRWLEYLLFSPSHGYVWLSLENGHWVFIRESKEVPSEHLTMQTPAKHAFSVKDLPFQVFETGVAKLIYVEGEFTWRAKVGDSSKFLDGICPPFLYSLEERGSEREFFWGEYVPPDEIARAFRVTVPDTVDIYANQPYVPNPVMEAVSQVALPFAGLNLILYFLLARKGSVVFSKFLASHEIQAENVEKAFTVTDPGKVLSMEFQAPVNNSWAFFDVGVQQGETEFFNLGQELAYYQGVEDGESWSEGNTEGLAYFRVPDSGSYTLDLSAEGGIDETSTGVPNVPLNLTIREGVRVGDYTFYLFILFLIAVIPHYWMKHSFERARWSQEEDD